MLAIRFLEKVVVVVVVAVKHTEVCTCAYGGKER